MKGIRSLTMSQETEPEPWRNPPKAAWNKTDELPGQRSLYDDEYLDELSAANYKDINEIKADRLKVTEITMHIGMEEITPATVAKYEDDWEQAVMNAEVTMIAYDRLKKLLGEKFEQEFSTKFVIEDYPEDIIDITAQLTSIK